jgi:hypothetical protein
MKEEILTPLHNYWNAFSYRLNQLLYTHTEGKPQFNCKHDLSNTKKILKTLPNIDVEGTLLLYQDLGGFCDCEVLMNVQCNWKP